jgi:very-short-patch-repair endonuclease
MWREEISEAMKAAWRRSTIMGSDEWRKKNSDGLRAAWDRGAYDEECRRKQSVGVKASWARGEHDGVVKNPSALEAAFAKALDACGIPYVQQHRLEGDGRPYDFVLPGNLLVEVDGDYWHGLPGAAERDQRKTELAAKRGYGLLRITESDVEKYGALAIVKERILPMAACICGG